MVAGAVCEHVFPAILLGIVFIAGNFGVVFGIPSGREAVQIALALAALLLSYRTFCATDTDRRLSDQQRQRRRRRRFPNSWQSLIWLERQHGRWLLWPGLILSFIAGLLFYRYLDFVWPAVTLAIGLVCGLAVFAPEQAGEQERFLGGQRLPPGRVWLVKTLFWALAAAGMTALYSYGLLTRNDQEAKSYQQAISFYGLLYSGESFGLFHILWVIYGFGCGQFCGLLSRKIVVAGALAIGVGAFLLAFWLPSILFGGVMVRQILTIPLLLLIAARLSMWLWFSGTLYSRRHFLLLAGCGVAILLWLGANLWYRAVEIPDVGEPFDVQAFNATLYQASRSEANQLLRRGLEFLERQREKVRDEVGPPTKPLFPPPLKQRDRYNSDPGGFLLPCQEVLDQGWPPQDDEINRWLDAMFAGEWAQEFRAAATKPLGLVVDPRTFRWADRVGRRPSMNLPDFSNVGLLFAVRAMQLQKRGDDRAALDCLETLFALSHQLDHCIPSTLGQLSGSIEPSALRAFDQCVLQIGSRPELLRHALKLLQRHDKETPDPLDGIKADYIITRNDPAQLWGYWADSVPKAFLLTWALETPWEGERQTRFIKAVYQARIRAAKLTPSEVAEREKQSKGQFWWVQTFGLTLTDSNWTPERWNQLADTIPKYFAWPRKRTYYATDFRDLRVRQVWLALMLYQIEEGKAAAKLDDLAPRYLASVPVDPETDEPFAYKVSQGEEIEGFFPAGKSPRQDRLLPGQGVLWLEAYQSVRRPEVRLDDQRIWYPVPVWRKE
jgi:hypothetical protein